MDAVTLEEAQERLPDLVAQAIGGRDIVITKDDKPVVRLVAVERARPRPRFGSAKGLITMAEDFDAPLADFAGYTR